MPPMSVQHLARSDRLFPTPIASPLWVTICGLASKAHHSCFRRVRTALGKSRSRLSLMMILDLRRLIHCAERLPSPRPSRRSHPWRHFLAFVFTRLNGDYRRELIVLLQVRLPENLRRIECNCSPVATVIE